MYLNVVFESFRSDSMHFTLSDHLWVFLFWLDELHFIQDFVDDVIRDFSKFNHSEHEVFQIVIQLQ